MGSQTLVQRIEGRSWAGAIACYSSKEDQRSDEETGRGRRMGAAKNVRHWLVGREEVP